MFSFELRAASGAARAGVLTTPHGPVETPAFMPVGTAGVVKALTRRGRGPKPPASSQLPRRRPLKWLLEPVTA